MSGVMEVFDAGHEALAAKKVGITDQTFYRWRIRYGALKEDEAKRLQLLEQENS